MLCIYIDAPLAVQHYILSTDIVENQFFFFFRRAHIYKATKLYGTLYIIIHTMFFSTMSMLCIYIGTSLTVHLLYSTHQQNNKKQS